MEIQDLVFYYQRAVMLAAEYLQFKHQDIVLLVCKRFRNLEQFDLAG